MAEYHRTKRRIRWRIVIPGMVLGILLAAVLFGYAYFRSIIGLRQYAPIDGNIPIETGLEHLDVPDNMKGGMNVPVVQGEQIRNILIIGTDTRDPNSNGRSDATMLLTINEKTKSLHLTSLMRAIYVSIPNDPDPAFSKYYTPLFMLNAAHTWGGPRLLLKTVQRNFRVEVTRYIETDFSGFKTAIDTVGGVDITLTAAEADYLNKHVKGASPAFHEGKMTLNGEHALMYARLRKIDSDFVRMSRQRQVLMSLFNKMKVSGVSRLNETAKALMPCVKTNLTDGELMSLILNAPKYVSYAFDQLSIPLETYDAMKYIHGMEMYDIDWVKNINALHAFMEK